MSLFRITSVLEGLSYLIILSVTAGLISRDFVFALGIAHGVLFLLYLVLSLHTSHKQGWSVMIWLMVFLAALVPFAFIAVEMYLRKSPQEPQVQTT
ncbi:DUF3817 domain-containing protein [Parendozoicomonas sp. Alg238-R29]|uniref:DUF3817 domain-containing protein n=1 Tax=Parendozoicomonas sp. Alg238-R29 TaxID=2993446 RepID=UPI00248DEEAA|nr:DUF3817 domain-containing protein [Parendozoicomonas sp. Alg238-R29]